MKKTNIKTETYQINGGFMIDIVTTDEEYDAFLYHKKNGIKSMMFGGLKKQQSYKEFLELVEANVEDYIPNYAEDYMDGYVCQLWVANRETGALIDQVENIAEGLEIIRQHEESDREEGTYAPDSYDIVTENHYSVLVGE